jgi:[ribosomal protein S5]-alanine N-acetyltransferase
MFIFESARLLARPIADTDFPHLFRLLSDPDTMRYIRAPFTEEQQCRERMAFWAEYAQKRPGLGNFILEMREGGAFAGCCVARQVGYDTASEEYEIGYILAPEHWGKGLASELVPPLSAYCFGQSAAAHLVAFTHPDNEASQRVLLKGGFRHIGARQTPDGTSAEFWLERG